MAAMVGGAEGPMVHMGMPGRNGRGTAVRDLRAFLVGGWTIVRTIRDRRVGAEGRFDGVARFAPAPQGLAYRETGRLALGDHEGPAEQAHTYVFPTPERAEVRFRDGRPFHPLDLTTGWATALHPCGPDLYRGRFLVLGADAWCVVWRVRGPRKDLTIASRFTRAPA